MEFFKGQTGRSLRLYTSTQASCRKAFRKIEMTKEAVLGDGLVFPPARSYCFLCSSE
ncbi:hypothetical protein KFK09_022358 [Dendrobium nobile]|uniref:Uncharacterized protein n=1 Tax=Dendrobium nobile TaxID=94219 RepID=A0A8T3AJ58_DENNO|nr:hypothetical protein KFK09_022358 [Dendrobium nobile]